jgi:CDP-paratose 2-epimerase
MDWPITIFGTGKQVRDIIYATDVCAAFDAFYKHRVPGIYNIGGSSLTAISLLECINMLEKLLGKKPKVKINSGRHGDLRYFICNIDKARKNLKWSPKIMPEEGVSRLLTWIKDNKDIFKGQSK